MRDLSHPMYWPTGKLVEAFQKGQIGYIEELRMRARSEDDKLAQAFLNSLHNPTK